MVLTHQSPLHAEGLLYPMMVIAAIAVMVFSLVGTASLTGWMPSALVSSTGVEQPAAAGSRIDAAASEAARPGAAFGCAECGVIESVRELERRGAGSDTGNEPVANGTAL